MKIAMAALRMKECRGIPSRGLLFARHSVAFLFSTSTNTTGHEEERQTRLSSYLFMREEVAHGLSGVEIYIAARSA